MMSKTMQLVILGPPGSGKGTISSRIVKEFKIAYLASGDLLRAHVCKESGQHDTSLSKLTEYLTHGHIIFPLEGLAAKEFIIKGQLVPDVLVTKLFLKELGSLANPNWLLDGFPRTIQQAEILSKKVVVSSVLYVNVPHEVIIDRLKGRWIHIPSGRIYHTEFNPPREVGIDDVTGEPLTQRPDDSPGTVKARLIHYKKDTEPVLDYYRKRNLLKQFSGSYTNEIWPQILEYLKN